MKKISKATIIRTIVLFVTMLNQLLTATGKNPLPFAEAEIYEFLTLVTTIAATIWAWWKNNSFTSAAIQADGYLNNLKNTDK